MARKILLSCLALLVSSGILFFLAQVLALPEFILFSSKAGLLIGGVCSFGITTSFYLIGRETTSKLITNLLVLFTTITFLLITCEFGLRFFFRDITTTSDNSSYFARKWKKNNLHLNSWGFREIEFPLAKPEGLYRVAVIGDSFTYGQGIPEEERFSNLLENYLSDKGYYQVLNFGKCGAESGDHLTVLKEVVLRTEPDFVILQWFVNDFEGKRKSGRPKYLPLSPSYFLHERLRRYSALYYFLNHKWRCLQAAVGSHGYVEYMHKRFHNPAAQDSLKAMKALANFINECRVRKIGLGIVLFPDFSFELGTSYPFMFLHERVVNLCKRNKIICIDLRATFARYRDRKALWVNHFDAHPGSFANEIAANRLIEAFAPIWLSANG
jgi:lysophospholipase L1-like esterase